MTIHAGSVAALIFAGIVGGSAARAATPATPIGRPAQIIAELPASLLPATSAGETQAIRDARQKWLDEHIKGRTITCAGEVRHLLRPASHVVILGLDCPDATLRGMKVVPTVAAVTPIARIERLAPLKPTLRVRARGTVDACCITRTIAKDRNGAKIEIVKLSIRVENCHILSATRE